VSLRPDDLNNSTYDNTSSYCNSNLMIIDAVTDVRSLDKDEEYDDVKPDNASVPN
jgi:hypothetical protein